MARLIEAEDAIGWMRAVSNTMPGEINSHGMTLWNNLKSAMIESIGYCPTVDAVEVVHGRWLTLEEYAEKIGADSTGYMGGWVFCSECDQQMRTINGWLYCPNCGAKMDGERKDK